MLEEWRKIEGFPHYEVSNTGVIRNVDTGRILKYGNKKGYHSVSLCHEGFIKPMTVHRLVAEAFCEGGDPNLHVNHIDGNKHNNNADNLEWVTPSENLLHAYRHGLRNPPCPNPKRVLIVETGEIFESASSCARHIGGLKSHVCECVNGERKTHMGYHFIEL